MTNPLANRVLTWNALPFANGEAADLVLGQTDFESLGPGKGADQMNLPDNCWTDGTRLLVTDGGNHRVLMWDEFPLEDGEAADRVLGWPAFGLGDGDTIASPPSTSSMAFPNDVFFDGTRLFVSDGGYHRVMVWQGLPTTSGEAADYFIGQFDGISGESNAGQSINAVGLNGPDGVVVAFGSLFIADSGNDRVVVHTPVPASSGFEADAVLGQPTLYIIESSTPASQTNLNAPKGLDVVGQSLWVADYSHRRVLRFGLSP